MVEERKKKSKKALMAMSRGSKSSKSICSTTTISTATSKKNTSPVQAQAQAQARSQKNDDAKENGDVSVKASIFDNLDDDIVEVSLRPMTAVSESDKVEVSKESKETDANKKKAKKNTIISSSGEIVDPQNWGFPGYLTQEENDIYEKFAAEISTKDKSWRDTIFSFGYNEGEEYAYCRWLRARKFVLKDTLTMIKEATALRFSSNAADADFYPDPETALGVEEALFKTLYPQVFAGHAKNSCPLFVSQPGKIQMTGLECITTIANMHKYQWHAMIHGAGSEYRARQRADADFRRFQSVAILDLDGLGLGTVTGSVMDMIKHQSYVDSLCFPETMNRLVVINAPGFFSATWNIIRRWLDARTAGKIEIYAARSKWEKRLKELVDNDQLPENYGGYGPTLDASILMKCNDLSVSRRVANVMTFKTHGSSAVTLEDGETMEIIVYTKSRATAEFSVVNAENKSLVIAEGKIVKLPIDGGKDVSKTRIALKIPGPGRFKIYGDVENGGFYSSSSDYLVVANIRKEGIPSS